MRFLLTACLLIALPFVAGAQERSAAPMLIVSGGSMVGQSTPATATAPTIPDGPVDADKMAASIPANAVTKIDKPAPVIAAPNAAAITKQWPRDSTRIFMKSCVGFHKEYITPCNCIITQVMDKMTHDEFMKLNETGTVEQDPRVQAIRTQCATQPQQRK